MDIERELETLINKHKGKQVGVGEIRLDWFAEDCLKEIRRLKAEIARQSVKSEEVQEAIEYLQPLTEHPIMSGNFAKHIKTAITALQAYQPWIPVSERKPTESELRNGMVLAWSTELSEWQVESWGYVEDRPEDYTHWKPLPEPPKGETE